MTGKAARAAAGQAVAATGAATAAAGVDLAAAEAVADGPVVIAAVTRETGVATASMTVDHGANF